MYYKKSKLLVLLVFTLALQPVISIKSMDAAVLHNAMALTDRILTFCEEHAYFISSVISDLNKKVTKDSSILAPVLEQKKDSTKNHVVNLEIEIGSDSVIFQLKKDFVNKALGSRNYLINNQQQVASNDSAGKTTQHTKLESVQASEPIVSLSTFEVSADKKAKLERWAKVFFVPKIEFDFGFNGSRELREYYLTEAIRKDQINKERIRKQNNPSGFGARFYFGPRDRTMNFAIPIEVIKEAEAFSRLKQNNEKGLNYLNYVNEFSILLLKTNSLNDLERVLARLEIVKYQDVYGPARQIMRDTISCIAKENFNQKTGELKNFVVSKNNAQDIAYFLDKIGHDENMIELREVTAKGLNQSISHLIFNEGFLDSNCRRLYKQYNSYDLDKVTAHNGSYKVDNNWVKERFHNVDFDKIQNSDFNETLVQDIDQINDFASDYDYHAAKTFVNRASSVNHKLWRQSLLDQIFTKNGIIKKFLNDPLYQKIAQEDLVVMANDTSKTSQGKTRLQHLNSMLAIRYADIMKLAGYYMPGESVQVSKEIDNALYNLYEHVLDEHKQFNTKAQFEQLLKFIKIENKELSKAFSNCGILKVFNNDFAVKCRRLDNSKVPTNQEFIDCANKIIFYDGYAANDSITRSKISKAKRMFFDAFPDKNTMNEEVVHRLKSLINDLENPPQKTVATSSSNQNISDSKENLLARMLREVVEACYPNSESSYDRFLLLCAIENELANQASASKPNLSNNGLVLEKSKDKVKKPKQEDAKKSKEKEKPEVKDDSKAKVKHPNGIYKDAKYHTKKGSGRKSKAPRDGQKALDESVKIKDTSPHRISIDQETGEFVILNKTSDGEYHGHVRKWNELEEAMKDKVQEVGWTNNKGKIIKK